MSALLNADPEIQKGNAGPLAAPMLWAVAHDQWETLGVLVGSTPTLARLELGVATKVLKQTLAALTPEAAASLLVRWLRTEDADYTALLAATLTDFVAICTYREAFRRAGGIADFVGRLAVNPEFLPALVHLRGKSAICRELVAHGAVSVLVQTVVHAQDPEVACAGLETLLPLVAIDGDLTPDQAAPLWAVVPALLAGSEASREATLDLLNCLSQKKGMTEPMARAGAADWILPWLASDDPITQAAALAVLRRLAKELSDVSCSGEHLVTLLAAQDSAVRAGAVRAIAEMEAEGKLELDTKQACETLAVARGLNEELTKASLKALLCVARRCREKKQAFGGTDAFYGQLVACLDAGNDTLVQQAAAHTLRMLATHPDEKERIGNTPGAIEILLKTLQSSDRQVNYGALACMVELAVCDANKKLLGTPAILSAVCSLVKDSYLPVGAAAASVLRNLAALPANCVFIGLLGGIEALGSRAMELPDEGRTDFVSALGNLAVDADNARKMIKRPRILRMLTQSLGSPDLALAKQAARALQNVSWLREGKQAIMKCEGIVPAVQATMHRADTAFCFQAMAMLANVAVLAEAKKPIIDAFIAVVPALVGEQPATLPVANAADVCAHGPPPGLKRLLELIDCPNDKYLASATLAMLRNVCMNDDVKPLLVKHGFVTAVVANLKHSYKPISVAAVATLGNLAADPTIRNAIGDEVVYQIIDLLNLRSADGSLDLQTTAARALTVFATDVPRCEILRTTGSLARVLELVPDCRLST